MVNDSLRIAELEKLLAERTAELNQRTEELAIINSVQEALVNQMDMQSIYDIVGDRIRDTFDAQGVIIASFDHDSGEEHFGYAIEKGERFQLKPRPFDKLRQSLIDTKQKIVINENFEDAYRQFGMRVLPGSEFPKSVLYVPLLIGEKVSGYVSLQNVDKENAFSESDVRLLETLANSMGTALENVRLLKETGQRTAELAVINSVQEALAKEIDIQGIYDLVGNRIRDLFDAQAVGIATFDHKNETEHIHYLIEKGERYYPAPRPLNILRKHLIAAREKILINKNFEEVAAAFGVKKVPGTEHPKSALYVPLVIGERVTGYISLQNIDKENAFADADVRLLETLANSMGVALENARLFDETSHLLKETEQQKAELGVINSVQEGLAKELDMQAIYDLVGNRIQELFNAQAVIIATFDHDAATEQFKYLFEDGQRFYLPPRPYDKLRQHLIVTRQKIVINSNYAEAYAKFGLKTLPGTSMTKSGVFVPLIIGDKINSYISLQNNEIENAFSDSDVRLLETLANSMSVALENARLFDETTRLLKETEQRTTELAVINSVQEGLARELDMNAIYELVGNKIRDVFDAQVVIIATFDHETGTEKFNYLIEKGEQFFPEPRRYDKLRYQLIVSKQKILINAKTEEALKEFGLKLIAGTEMPKSVLYVPLVVGNKVTSYVSLQNLDRENAFSESDVRLLETLANSMSVALENARLFDETNRLLKETEQRTSELAVINSVQEGFVAQVDLQGIYELVGEKLREIFNAQVIDIVVYDSNTNLIEDHYAYEKGDRTLVGKWEPKGFRKYVIDTGQLLVINEKLEEKGIEYNAEVIHGEMPKSVVFVPMLTAGKVKGMISLQNLDKENAFSDSDVRLLTTLANSMSVALESVHRFDETNRLLKETEQRTSELAVINSVQEGLVAQMDMQSIYDLVGEKIRNIFDAPIVDIVTYDKEKNLIEDCYAYEKGDRTLLGAREPKGFRKHVIESKQLLLINKDLEKKLTEYDNEILIGDMPKSNLFVPLLSRGEVSGIISLQNLDHENAFSDSDVSLLTTLANSMSVALESAALFHQTNKLLKETEERTAELAVINSVQEGLVREMDITAIYELVGEKIRQIFNAQVIDIVTYDAKQDFIEDKYAYEKGDRTLLGQRKPKGFRKHVIETAKPIIINKNLEAERSKYDQTVVIGEGAKSIVLVPMISAGEVKGVISLQNLDQEDAFSESNVNLLNTLANSMSVALQNASLFDETNRLLKETEQRTEELALINNVQEGLAKELDVQGIFDLVGNRVEKLFHTHAVIIASFDFSNNTEVFNYAYEDGRRLKFEPRPIGGLRQKLVERKQLIYIESEEAARTDFGITPIADTSMPKSLLFVPVMSGQVIKGYISIQDIDKEYAYTDADINLLVTLSNSMSVALENVRLFDETKQRAAELGTVNNISKALASLLNAEDLIKMVGDHLKDLFKANIVYLALLNEKTKVIHFPYQYGEAMPVRMLGEGLTSSIILSGEPLLLNKDIDEKAEELGVGQYGLPSLSYLGVPIPVRDAIIGVLSVQSTETENRFNENDLRLLSTIASSVGVALNNAKLFEDVKLAKMEAEAASKAAEKANEAKSAFLSTVSHELRTPLTSVLGFTKIIRKRLEEKIFPLVQTADAKSAKAIAQVSENLDVVVSEGERLTNLINDVLDLAKIEAGKMEWNQEKISIADVAERAIAATSSLFDQKALKLYKHIDHNVPEITGDKDKLIQVIINLISNSVKFTDKGSVTCKVMQENNDIVVSITDTGIGIAEEDFGAVFEQFKQVGGDTLTDKPKGTGLGLPICKQIVEHHGGKIWLESKVGSGSTFSFSLPLVKTNEAARPMHLDELVKQLKEQVAFSQLSVQGKSATILVVDDDPSIRSLLSQELGEAGYMIDEAANGKEALARVRASRPDLIILDVMMPEMNGFDVAAVLKNDPQTMDIPIIVLSIVQDKTRGFRIGVDRYLTKPIDTGLLFTEIGSLLEQGKSKKKVLVVDQDAATAGTITEVLQTKGYAVMETNEQELMEKAVASQPDIIIINSLISGKHDIVQSLRFEKGLENVLFLVYQ